MSPVRIALLSDDRLFREGLASILGAEPSVTVVESSGEPPRGAAGLDVLIVDSRTEGALGMCAAVKRSHGPAVIFVSAPEEDAWAHGVLGAGARGILGKGARTDDLLQAVRVVHQGGVWASRRVLAECITRLTGASAARSASEVVLEHQLSSREREVFRHAATGLSNKELADRLAISRATVKAHLTQIFQKLGVNGRAQLAAVFHGVVPPKTRPGNGRDARPTVVRLKA